MEGDGEAGGGSGGPGRTKPRRSRLATASARAAAAEPSISGPVRATAGPQPSAAGSAGAPWPVMQRRDRLEKRPALGGGSASASRVTASSSAGVNGSSATSPARYTCCHRSSIPTGPRPVRFPRQITGRPASRRPSPRPRRDGVLDDPGGARRVRDGQHHPAVGAVAQFDPERRGPGVGADQPGRSP